MMRKTLLISKSKYLMVYSLKVLTIDNLIFSPLLNAFLKKTEL